MKNRVARKLGLGGLVVLGSLLLILALPRIGIARPRIAPAAQTTMGMVCETGTTFDLETAHGYVSMPDGNSIFMWGYTLVGNPFQSPSPVLCVNEGDAVTVNLTNNLPEPVSMVFPGQSGVSASMVSGTGTSGLLTLEANSGETVRYTFTAGEPGTYLYESGTIAFKQIHMGLYGALVVRPALGANFAYNDASTQFDPDREYLLILHEFDPDLHAAVERGDPYEITTRHNRYFTINGRSMPDTLADNNVPWLPNQPYGALVTVEASVDGSALPALIRYANAGMDNHPFHPHGNHLRVIARDGRLLCSGLADCSIEAFTRSISAGQTMDLLFRWVDVDAWTTSGNPIPVEIPGLQNLVFKDDVTFYSGDAYLGQQDDNDPNVTIFNQCGEFYFPWHSHALQEVQNFDEGFGGMMTLVRVEPPGGCP